MTKAIKSIKTPRFKYPILLTLKIYLAITLGLIIYAIGWTLFIIPSGLVGGGITGVSVLIYYAASSADIANNFTFGLSYLSINIVLLILGAKPLGLRLGIKTIYSIIVLSVFFTLSKNYFSEPLLNSSLLVDNQIIAAIIGGVLSGVGIGIVFSQGGSIGGTDIIAMAIEKYRSITPGRMILLFDVIIISSSYFIFQSIEIIVLGFLMLAVMFYATDMLLMGHRESVQLFIFSRKHDEIAKRIANDIGRSVSLVNAKGWYSKEDAYMLMVVVRKHETADVYKTIKEIDPEAFLTVANVMGVYGKGYDPVKH